MSDELQRIIDQELDTELHPDDVLIVDSKVYGTRKITYQALCSAVAGTLGISSIQSAAEGAMQKAVYDKNGDGIVDDAAKVSGHTVETNVPKDAVFTDTIYDDAPVQKNTENLLSMGLENIDGVLNAVYEEE